MKSKGVTTIINVQLPGEHPWCGDKLAGNGGFSYLPEEIFNAGMFFFNPGWPDMTAPSMEHLINVIQVMTFQIEQGSKVLIHCHAGHGRTGLVIGAYYAYTTNLSVPEIIKKVRTQRPPWLKNGCQIKALKKFKEYIDKARVVFPREPITLQEHLKYQDAVLHGMELKQMANIPKPAAIAFKHLDDNAPQYPCDLIGYALVEPGNDIFASVDYRDYIENSNDGTGSSDRYCAATFLGKLDNLKEEVNNGDWENMLQQNDARIYAAFLLDWLDNSVKNGILNSVETKQIQRILEQPDCNVDRDVSARFHPSIFSFLDSVCRCLLAHIKNEELREVVSTRIAISLLGEGLAHATMISAGISSHMQQASASVKDLSNVLIQWALRKYAD